MEVRGGEDNAAYDREEETLPAVQITAVEVQADADADEVTQIRFS